MASLATMLLAILMLGAEVFVVAVAALGWLVTRTRLGLAEIAVAGGLLLAGAIVYVGWITMVQLALPV